jgi:hypothetical protein
MQASTAAFGTIIAGNEMVVEHDVQIKLPITRKNLCTCPSFNDGLGNWYGGTLSTSTAHVFAGTQAMHVLWPTNTAFNNQTILNIPDALPGVFYMISMMVYLDSGATGIAIGNSTGGNTVSTTGSWQQLYGYIDGGNPTIFIYNTGAWTGGSTGGFWVDTVLVEIGTVVNPYFDGDTANAVWTGIPGLSTSTLYTDPYIDLVGAVESVRITRSLTTDAPPGTRLISGYPTASAVIVLSALLDPTDSSKNAVWLFDPDETTSPLYQHPPSLSPVTITHGVYTAAAAELITTFTGFIDDCIVDALAGTVTITALDPLTRFRPSVTIPPIAWLDTAHGNSPGLTASWVIDYVARQNGYYSSPPPRSQCFFYASLHGSAWPEVMGNPAPTWTPVVANMSLDVFTDPTTSGLTGSPLDYLGQMQPGFWGSQVVRNPSILFAPIPDAIRGSNGPNIDAGNVNALNYFEGWLYADATQGGSGGGSYWSVLTHNGNYSKIKWTWALGGGTATASMDVQRDSGSLLNIALGGATMSTNAFHHVACQVVFTASTTANVILTIDGVTTTTNVSGLPATGGDVNVFYSNFVWLGYADTVQLTNESYPQPVGATRTFTPTAVIDASLNPLTAIPDTTTLTAKQVLQQIASAERGICGFDELGVLRFKNRQTIRTATSSRTVTSATSLKQLQSDTGMAAVATRIQVPCAPLAQALPGIVWRAPTVIHVPAGTTYSAIVQLSQPTLTPQALDSGYNATVGGGAAGTTYWRASSTPGGGSAISTSITVRTYSVSGALMVIQITNANGFDVWMVSPASLTDVPAGTPYVFIGGVGLTSTTGVLADRQWPDAADGGAATNQDFGEVLLQLPANTWMQDTQTADTLAGDTLSDTFRPRPLLTNVQIIFDPRLQLSDRITFSDPDGSIGKIQDDALLVGLDSIDSKTDWTTMISALRISAPGDWIMGQTGRSELGSTTYT